MQLYASLDLQDEEFCFIKQHSETSYTWSLWSDRSKRPIDMTVSHPAFSRDTSSNLIVLMREEGYPTFPVPSVHHTYEDLYTLYLQHQKDHPEIYI